MVEAQTYSPRQWPQPCSLLIAAMAAVATTIICAMLAAAVVQISDPRIILGAVIVGCLLPGFLTAHLCRWCDVAHYASTALLALFAAAVFNYAFLVMRLWLLFPEQAPALLPGNITLAFRQLPQRLVWENFITGEQKPFTRSDAQLFMVAHLALLLGLVLNPLIAWLVSRYQPPMCPMCRQWLTSPITLSAVRPPCPPHRFAYQLSQQRYDLLNQLEPEPDPLHQPHVKLAVFACPDCGGDHWLNVWEVRFDNSTGKTERAEQRLIRHQIVEPAIVSRINAIKQPHAPQPQSEVSS